MKLPKKDAQISEDDQIRNGMAAAESVLARKAKELAKGCGGVPEVTLRMMLDNGGRCPCLSALRVLLEEAAARELEKRQVEHAAQQAR